MFYSIIRNSDIQNSYFCLVNKIRWKIAQFFELRWWRGYLKKKSPQEYLQWKRDYWKAFLEKISLETTMLREPIIDIGCGPAGIFTVLASKQITALDPLLEAYEELSIFEKLDYPEVDFVAKSFEDYEVERQFETLFCLNAINHFIEIESSFKQLHNISKNDGKLILSIDAHNHRFFRWLFAILPLDILHPHQYYLEEYETMLMAAGFTIETKVCLKKEFFFDYWVIVAKAS